MTDLAIAILSGAGLGAAAMVFVLALKMLSIQEERRKSDVTSEKLTGQLAITTANLTTEKNRADSERARADALDDLVASTIDGPADGAYARLLQKWSAARRGPADLTSTRAMPAPPAAAEARSDDLLRPGEG